MVVNFNGLRSEDPMRELKIVGWGNIAQQMIDDLYVQLGALSDRYHFSNKKEFSTKEYIVEYDKLKKKITDLEK